MILDYKLYTEANSNGHGVQSRGFSLVSKKIDLSFPTGHHMLLLGYMRPSDVIQFQSVKGISYTND